MVLRWIDFRGIMFVEKKCAWSNSPADLSVAAVLAASFVGTSLWIGRKPFICSPLRNSLHLLTTGAKVITFKIKRLQSLYPLLGFSKKVIVFVLCRLQPLFAKHPGWG